jgi:hypothetical protein
MCQHPEGDRMQARLNKSVRHGRATHGIGWRQERVALTLVELLLAISILSLMAGAVGVLARTVSVSTQYSENATTSLQHGRVTLERISRTIAAAHANENFPGAIVVPETVSGVRHPHTVVVWKPSGTPASPEGLPRFSELVVFAPSLTAPNELREFTFPTDTRTAPPITSAASWQTELAALKAAAATKKVLLTDRMRVSTASGETEKRGAVRFEVQYRPSRAEWANFRSGALAWNDITWPQDLFGSQTGLAQTWIRIELQLVPFASSRVVTSSETLMPLFGSGAVNFELKQ